MGPIEQRISRMEHPDLPDLSADSTRSNQTNSTQSASSRTSWRPSWLARSSTSSQSQRSSLATSRSDSVSTRIATADVQNIYQLPANAIATDAKNDESQAALDDCASSSLPAMRFEYDDESFDFPLPIAAQAQSQPELQTEAFLARMPDTPSDLGRSNTSSRWTSSSKTSRSSYGGHFCSSESSSRPTTSMSFRQRTFGMRKLHEAEVEMVSKGQYGYWNASFVARLNAAAAVCGGILLTAKFPPTPTAGVNIHNISETTTARFSLELYETATPDELTKVVRGYGLGSIALILKASLNAAKAPGIPVKVAMAIFKRMKGTTENNRHTIWPHVLKQLKKIPQDQLVLLMFLSCIARKLQQANVTINGHASSEFLLDGMFPSTLAISEDPMAGQRLARLLVDHFDEISADFPAALEAINYRFPCGKRANLLALMVDKKREKTGAEGIKEIVGAEHRAYQW